MSDSVAECVGVEDRLAAGSKAGVELELLTMVNVARDATDASACAAVDTGHDGAITIDEILAAVNAALTACPTA